MIKFLERMMTIVTFENQNKIIFEMEDMSNVSFIATDITQVRFNDKIMWNQKDRFKVIEEDWLEQRAIRESDDSRKEVSLGRVQSVYRNLRENYEFRLRYDEAGKFFIREMELKRKYREIRSEEENNSIIIKPNGWVRRNLSLAGLYYHLAKYGEDLRRPTFFGLTIISASIIAYLLIQQEQQLVTHPLSFSYKGLSPIGNAFENSTTVFLQLRNEHLVWYDYIFKSLGILTLGIFAIPLRRRFERKFRH